MDPASLSNLDPKLRETYERVMGATGSAASTPPTPKPEETTSTTTTPDSAATPDATSAKPASTTVPTPDSASKLSTPAVDPILANSATNDQPQTVTIDQPLPNPAASNVITPPHGHMGLIKVFYAFGGIVFFVIYVFFWMKILNVSLPF